MIPMPYRILAAAGFAIALFGAGLYTGHDWATTRAQAARTKQAEEYARMLRAETKRGDALSRKLGETETRIVYRNVEVIKHVPTVTTGRLCLGADAVGLLQPSAAAGQDQPAGPSVAESPAHAAASDRDAAYWIADANRLYETCAARLNTLIDWEAETIGGAD